MLDNPPVTLTNKENHTQGGSNLSQIYSYLTEGWIKIVDRVTKF